MNKLIHKTVIKGEIKIKTGLHIGGTESSVEIGSLEQNNIIKTANGIPYIPGSSLKGKLRNLLAKVTGSEDVNDKAEQEYKTHEIFGVGATDSSTYSEALLRIRDACLKPKSVEDFQMDFKYSEVKYEVSIPRLNGETNLRPIERVPAGAIFDFEMVYDYFDKNNENEHLDKIAFAMQLLQLDSLGGSGTRGSGKVKFQNIKMYKYAIDSSKNSIQEQKQQDVKPFDVFNDESNSN